MNSISRRFTGFLCALVLILTPGCYRPGERRTRKQKQERGKALKPRKPQVQIRQMSSEEAIRAASYYEEVGNQELLIASYNRIIATETDPEVVASYILKLADLYLGEGNFAEAIKQYRRAITLYPGTSTIERARYREITAHFWSSLNPHRDQATTQTTIKLGKQYLADFPQEPSADQVRSMIAASYYKLLENELLIIEFYRTKYETTGMVSALRSIAQRITYIAEHLIDEMQKFVPEVAALREELHLPILSEEFEDDLAAHAHVDKELAAIELVLDRHLHGSAPSIDLSHSRDKF